MFLKRDRQVKSGGSWSYYPRNCRSACRNNNNPGDRFNNIGFRVVCEAQHSSAPELAGGNLPSVPREESRPVPAMPRHPKSKQGQRA
ncbi:MAG: SUMF1/EgtB/PvdO family nonheme iron enzyme [Leptolyngbya sp. SIO4C5]|nr:SUMF1/EgtB/PvdO family nonheme iron enzyme [Leptolyngbya sp. SIO4C5]